MDKLGEDPAVQVICALKLLEPDSIYDGPPGTRSAVQSWVINDSRVAFDAADFMRDEPTIGISKSMQALPAGQFKDRTGSLDIVIHNVWIIDIK